MRIITELSATQWNRWIGLIREDEAKAWPGNAVSIFRKMFSTSVMPDPRLLNEALVLGAGLDRAAVAQMLMGYNPGVKLNEAEANASGQSDTQDR